MRRVCITMGRNAGYVGDLNLARNERRYIRARQGSGPNARRGVGGMGLRAKGVFGRKR
jgi:hypothetical protein